MMDGLGFLDEFIYIPVCFCGNILKYIKELIALMLSFGSNHTSIGLIPLKTLRNDALEGVSLEASTHYTISKCRMPEKVVIPQRYITDF